MKAIEFHTKLHTSGTAIEIPEPFHGHIKTGQKIRVIVLLDDAGNDSPSHDTSAQQPFAGITEADTEYDTL